MRRISATAVFLFALWASAAAAQSRRHRPPPAPPPPSAEEANQAANDAAARSRFEAGFTFYEAGRFEEALPEFQAAWQLSQRPAMLINIANAAERSLQFSVAIDALRLYLERAPDSPDRDATERRIARDESTVARAPAAAQPTPAPPTAPVVLPAAASSEGAPVGAIITLSAGGALAIGAVITGLLAHGTYGDLQTACVEGGCPPDRASDLSTGKTLALVSTILTGAAIVAGGVGLLMLFLSGSDDEAPETRARLELAPGPALVGATARVRF